MQFDPFNIQSCLQQVVRDFVVYIHRSDMYCKKKLEKNTIMCFKNQLFTGYCDVFKMNSSFIYFILFSLVSGMPANEAVACPFMDNGIGVLSVYEFVTSIMRQECPEQLPHTSIGERKYRILPCKCPL